MKLVSWVGPYSTATRPLRDFIDANYPPHPATLHTRGSSKFNPFLFISEDLETLLKTSSRYPSAAQLLVCRSSDFCKYLENGVRPNNQFYFLIDTQALEEFRNLVQRLESERVQGNQGPQPQGSLPSMQNALAVLKRLTDERLFELKTFSQQEEERRKTTRSLVQLARQLSMSRDIEEVVQYLWNDLKTIDGLSGIGVLVFDLAGRCHQVVPRSGKFHFEEIASLSAETLSLLRHWASDLPAGQLRRLSASEDSVLHQLSHLNPRDTLLYRLSAEDGEKIFFLLIQPEGEWHATDAFKTYLQERLAFVHLTLEKHLLQEDLKTKANLWATTFDDLKDPLAIITQSRIVVRSNHQFKGVRGSPCHSHWALKDQICAGCPSLINERTTFELENGEKIFQARLFPISDNLNSSAQAFVAHYIDVTTERLLYSRLLQSEKMVAIGKLAGDLSEALTAPLKKIIEVTDRLLQLEQLERLTRSDLTEIRKASHRSLRIIEDFENFSRGQLEKSLIMAETIVEKTIPLVKALLHGHRFHLQLAENRHPIQASLPLLQQVLYNLLRNAQQAMLANHGEIKIITETRTLEGQEGVCISVEDSGCGLPAEMKEKIFQPFVTTRSSSGGTGLGLNIVKQIVENHSGRVGYAPRMEGGSIFWIWLPIVSLLNSP